MTVAAGERNDGTKKAEALLCLEDARRVMAAIGRQTVWLVVIGGAVRSWMKEQHNNWFAGTKYERKIKK